MKIEDAESTGLHDLLFEKLAPKTAENGIPIPSLSLEDLLRQHKVNEYSLVSDIEGAEISFLKHNLKGPCTYALGL